MRILLSIVMIGIFFLSASSQTILSGDVSGKTLQKSGNPYFIQENIFVKASGQLTIQEGCILLFNPFAGMVIEGSILVNGSSTDPVVFTSVNDSSCNPTSQTSPAPFDWNGITIRSNAREITLNHFTLSYSVYGIKSKTPHLTVTHGTFKNNGQFSFTINNEIQSVAENLPFSYSLSGKNTGKSDTSPTSVTLSPKHRWQRPVLLTSSIGGLGGLGAMGYFIYMENKYHKKYNATSDQTDMNRYDDKRHRYRSYAIATGCTGGGILLTSALLMIIDAKKNASPSVALFPHSNNEGIGVVFNMAF